MNLGTSGIRPRSPRAPLSFDRLVAEAGEVRGVARKDVSPGDRVVVYTRNSVYTLRPVEGGLFEVSGGWFDRDDIGSARITVTGCTWGGSAIRRDLLAGCGLRVEFGNRVITSVVQRVVHFPGGLLN